MASLRIENRKSAPGWSTCAAEKAPPECGPRLGASVNSDQRRGVWIPSAAAGVLILALKGDDTSVVDGLGSGAATSSTPPAGSVCRRSTISTIGPKAPIGAAGS
jgi:hypothetical protein